MFYALFSNLQGFENLEGLKTKSNLTTLYSQPLTIAIQEPPTPLQRPSALNKG